MIYSDIIHLPSNYYHGILLYKNNEQRNEILINYLNEALAKGHRCIYAPVDPYYNSSESNSSSTTTRISAISSKILNYYENIQNGNLQIINMRHYYYESAIRREMKFLMNIKVELQKALSHPKYD